MPGKHYKITIILISILLRSVCAHAVTEPRCGTEGIVIGSSRRGEVPFQTVQFLMGVGGYAVGAIGGFFLCEKIPGVRYFSLLGALAGGTAGCAAMIDLEGDLRGRKGKFTTTLLGTLLGTAAGFGLMYALSDANLDDAAGLVAMASPVLLGAGFGTVSYGLSDKKRRTLSYTIRF